MKPNFIQILCLISLLLGIVTGCNPTPVATVPAENPTVSSPTIPAATTLQTSEPTTAPVITPVAADGYRLAYDFNVAINYEEKQVEVGQTIVMHELPDGVGNLLLVVEPNRFQGGFSLSNISVNEIEVGDYTLEGNQLGFRLPEGVQTADSIQINLIFTLQLPTIPPPSDLYKPQPYGYTDRQLNLVDWYPFVPPLDDLNQWVIHPPHVFGETLVYPLADFNVELELYGNNTPLIVAASGQGSRTENRYHYEMRQARNFVVSVSPNYQVLEREAAGVTIQAYAFSESTLQNQAVIEYASQALALYSELFGALPRQTVSIVQADFLDGMEYDGLYFVSKGFYSLFDGTVNGYLSLITVHEMAHQWWYGVVGNDQAIDPWLDEGLSTFAELQYIERFYPDQVDWWWAYRVNYYQPDGLIDLPVYDYQFYIGYRNSVYLRSAQFLAALREQAGVEDYNTAIKRYVQASMGKINRPEDFWMAFSDAPGYPFSALRLMYFQNQP